MSQNELEDELEAPHPHELLPGWLTERMMTDVWSFGLLTVEGTLIGISSINKIYQSADGSVWIDVELLDREISDKKLTQYKKLTAPTSRTTASINTKNIIAAFELADT